jgi:hypothetical protein
MDDGTSPRHIATGMSNVKALEEVQGGWLVTCRFYPARVKFLSDDGGPRNLHAQLHDASEEDMDVGAFATVPGLGLVVLDIAEGDMLLLSTRDLLAMWNMSAMRVAWITAVVFSSHQHRRV